MSTINSINPKNLDNSKYFLITIDVEDWFHVENFKPWIPFETWDNADSASKEISIDSLTCSTPFHCLLYHKFKNLAKSGNSPKNICLSMPKATFFVLGWIAEKFPHLVRQIAKRGHEVASHGFYHDLPSKMSTRVIRQDLTDSRERLEEITGTPISGYRAPSFRN